MKQIKQFAWYYFCIHVVIIWSCWTIEIGYAVVENWQRRLFRSGNTTRLLNGLGCEKSVIPSRLSLFLRCFLSYFLITNPEAFGVWNYVEPTQRRKYYFRPLQSKAKLKLFFNLCVAVIVVVSLNFKVQGYFCMNPSPFPINDLCNLQCAQTDPYRLWDITWLGALRKDERWHTLVWPGDDTRKGARRGAWCAWLTEDGIWQSGRVKVGGGIKEGDK